MSSLDKIGVKVIAAPIAAATETTTAGNALPLLHEIAALVQALADRGEEGCIDLRSLPLAPDDYERLRTWLGTGEVHATIEAAGDAAGKTIARETRYAGVWWVTYYGADDNEVAADRIEITPVPAILESHPADVSAAAQRLRHDIMIGPGPHPNG